MMAALAWVCFVATFASTSSTAQNTFSLLFAVLIIGSGWPRQNEG